MSEHVWNQEEALKLSLDYFKGDELAVDVFLEKYALRDSNDRLLEATPDQMHHRLAREFARIEAKYSDPLTEEEIFGLFDGFRYVIPQGSPMSGIGNTHKLQSLSNCFVLSSPVDSIGGIARTDEEEAQIMKRRGGVGFDISNIRPRGVTTANAARTTDGIGAFMEKFSNTCRTIAQGGRRGALMLTISCLHPEIETFINIKRDLKKVTGANVSIKVTDDFMKAVESNSEFELRWPVDAMGDDVKYRKVVQARDIWNQMMSAAHMSAEPGILFWDTVLKESPSDSYASRGFKSLSTNPCSEVPLSVGDSCRLMLLNVFSYVDDPFTPNAVFNKALFLDHVKKAQRLMDDLVDLEVEAVTRILAKVEQDPEQESLKSVEMNLWRSVIVAGQQGRRTGLGVTGVGDAIAALGQRYASPESIETVKKIYETLAIGSELSGTELAEQRGTFPVYDYDLEKDNPYLLRVTKASPEFAKRWKKHGRRNISTTTTAPCGSVSILTQTTSGIEPAFLLHHKRRKKINSNSQDIKADFVDDVGDRWQEYDVYHHGVKQWMQATGETDITKSPYWDSTANKIDWESSVDLQAAAQQYVSHAISRTCNLPADVSVETVSNVYMRAWKSGLKGFTIYRDGSRSGVLVAADDKKQPLANTQPNGMVETHAPKRPKELDCDIHQVKIAGESWTILVGLFNNHPYEVFGGLSSYVEVPKKIKKGILVKNGKKDGLATYNLKIQIGDEDLVFKDIVNLFENLTFGFFTRTLSLALRHGIPIQFICEQLVKDKHSDMMSFSRVIARVLKGYIPDGTKTTDDKTCPTCKTDNSLIYKEGCVACVNCAYSKCA